MIGKRSFAMVLLCALGSSPALAFDAYNNFGPADTYDIATVHAVNGTSAAPFTPAISGSRFTSAATGQLAVIRIALHHALGTNLVDIRLHEANAAGELGPIIASFTRSGLPPLGGLDAPETILNSDPLVTLTTGNQYWIVVAPGDSNTVAGWNWNSTGATDRHTLSTDSGGSYTYDDRRVGALRVEVVPEPASITAMALAGWVLLRRRGR